MTTHWQIRFSFLKGSNFINKKTTATATTFFCLIATRERKKLVTPYFFTIPEKTPFIFQESKSSVWGVIGVLFSLLYLFFKESIFFFPCHQEIRCIIYFFHPIRMHIAEFVDGRHQLIVGIGRAVVFISEHFLNPKHHDSKLQSWFWCWVLLLAVVLQNKWHKFKLCQTCTLVFAQSTLLHNNKLSRVKIKYHVSISRNFREIYFTKKILNIFIDFRFSGSDSIRHITNL